MCFSGKCFVGVFLFGGSGEIWCCWLGWGFVGGEDVDVDEPVGYFGPVEVAGEGFVVGAAEDAVDVGGAVFDFAGAGHFEGEGVFGEDVTGGVVGGHVADAAGIHGSDYGDDRAVRDVVFREFSGESGEDFFAGTDRDRKHG